VSGEADSYLSLGEVRTAHGVHGNLKIFPFSDDLTPLKSGLPLLAVGPEGSRSSRLTVRWCRSHGRFLLLACEEITSREQAQKLAGYTLYVSRSDLPPLAEDTYYWDDIVGLSVFNGENRFVGRVTEIVPTGSNDVYVVYDEKTQAETLIPAIYSVVKSVDLDSGAMYVDLPESLG